MTGMCGVSLDVLVFRQVWLHSTGVMPRLTRQPVIKLVLQSVSAASLFSAFFLSMTARPFDPF